MEFNDRSVEEVRKSRSRMATFRKGVYIFPNMITTAALFCGFYAIITTMKADPITPGNSFITAGWFILMAMVFDALDGRVARLTNTTSAFGVEYDSLADLISFGLAPSLLIYKYALLDFGKWGYLAAFLYAACTALRLARFNIQVDTVERNRFVGLASPVAAAVLVTTILLAHELEKRFGIPISENRHVAILIMTYAVSILMVTNTPYLSFKSMKFMQRQPFGTMFLFLVLFTLVIAEPEFMLFILVFLYVASGPVEYLGRIILRKPKIKLFNKPGEHAVEDDDEEAA
jgi:CDP-diacylglycerol---serine O-phosphatidyltransferase